MEIPEAACAATPSSLEGPFLANTKHRKMAAHTANMTSPSFTAVEADRGAKAFDDEVLV